MTNIAQCLEAIAAQAARDELAFSTHTGVAWRVQRELDNPDCALDRLATLIAAEPVLAARSIGLANSVAHNPGGRPVTDVKSAATRIGFSALRALTASILVRQLAGSAHTPAQQSAAAQLWEHTAHVAALARVLARRLTRQNPDTAFFAGIVHEIGSFYLISHAAHQPELLHSDLELWHEDVEAMTGRTLLRAMSVPNAVCDALETLWSGYLSMPPSTLGDTLLLADELAPVESPLAALTGMSRQGLAVDLELVADAETLSQILSESADEVASLTHVLQQ